MGNVVKIKYFVNTFTIMARKSPQCLILVDNVVILFNKLFKVGQKFKMMQNSVQKNRLTILNIHIYIGTYQRFDPNLKEPVLEPEPLKY